MADCCCSPPLLIKGAALDVFGTGTGCPDVIVAAIMATLALQGAAIVVRQSLSKLRRPAAMPAE